MRRLRRQKPRERSLGF
ncbi:hypothetical protein [Rhizobium sp. S152]